MRIRKFIGRTMKEAVANVKHELGPDAVIISAKETRRGLFAAPFIEVSAGIEVDALDKKSVEPPPPAPPPPPLYLHDKEDKEQKPLDEADVERIVGPLKAELRHLRILVRQQSQVTGGDLKNEIATLRVAMEDLSRTAMNANRVSDTVSIDAVAEGAALVAESNGHYVAVVGPSGVGKTTTIAKLASRDALVYRRNVALITLDVYRIGAVEQIRAYADLIGIPLEVVADPRELAHAAARLDRADRIYIDTGGRNPTEVGAQNALIAEAMAKLDDLEVHLAVPATASAHQIDQVMTRFKVLRPDRLIFTKCDEADDLSELVYTPARTRTPVSYITMGQRVPEDLEAARADRLIALAKEGNRALAVAA